MKKYMVGVKGLGARGESMECQKLAVYSWTGRVNHIYIWVDGEMVDAPGCGPGFIVSSSLTPPSIYLISSAEEQEISNLWVGSSSLSWGAKYPVSSIGRAQVYETWG